MKNTYKVHWADVAELDLVEIIEYIAEDSPVAAKRVFKNITERAESLCHTPEKCRVVPELLDQGITNYREIIVAPWRIIYKIEKKDVYVLSVIDGRRNVEDVLLYRLATRKLR
ncbi:MAG: type II toxin-antitoxin system RelE/ParE family toxin [Deltaproteobacteria bacterium]|nr:type II toxin-antitoxin system RelE/ParE family toxin [Deltaproteobacteria bacterium]MBN2671496.1 type II toxin-antitoxin system RelE/ParE family toxin [Deltaproteobacteria bacterium]